MFTAIALALIVAGLRFYEQSSRAAAISDNIRLLNALVTEMRDANMRTGTVVRWERRDADGNVVWAGDPAWEEVAAYLIEAGAVPGNRVIDAATVRDTRGRPMPLYVGTVDIDPTGQWLGPGYVAGIDGEITVAECTRMAPVDSRGSSRAGHGITQVYLFSDTGSDPLEYLAEPPFSPSEASAECARIFGRQGLTDGLLMFTFRP